MAPKKAKSMATAATAAVGLPLRCYKYLVIVESPSKCKKIEEILGKDYKVIATRGHIYEINGLSAINKKTFEPTYSILSHQKDTVKKLRETIELAETVFLATDDDREGEAISYHVALECGLPIETTPRVVFHEITAPAILAGIQNPRRISIDLIRAQQARAVLDIIVGFKLSPLLWKYIPKNAGGGDGGDTLSAGRCQSVALRFIYDNYKEREIAAKEFARKPVYKINGYFFSKNIEFKLNHTFEKENDVQTFLEKSRDFQHTYLWENSTKTRTSVASSPKPFNTSSLIQTCSNLLHISPHQTMQICQTLYQTGYITYMRTNSKHFAAPFVEEGKKYIKRKYGEDFLAGEEKLVSITAAAAAAAATSASSSAGAAVAEPESHEAIRPTHLDCESIAADSCTPRERSVYRIIRNQTIQSMMADAIMENRTIQITSPIDVFYEHHISRPIFWGWKKVCAGEHTEDEENAEATPTPATDYLFFESMAKKDTPINYNLIHSVATIQHKLPPHYTEASLVKTLEDRGIGRPSTFSFLTEIIQKRGYVKKTDIEGIKISCREFILSGGEIKEIVKEKEFAKETKKLAIEPVGLCVLEFLLKYFSDFLDYKYTSFMEFELDLLSKGGGTTYKKICGDCYDKIKELIKPIKSSIEKEYEIDENHKLVYTMKGPVILARAAGDAPDAPPIYKKIKPGLELDINKLILKEYKIEDLLEITEDCLGIYEDHPLYLRNGRFGLYVEWGENKSSIKNIQKPVNQITLNDVITYLSTAGSAASASNVLHIINPDISIRKGKYGAYIFYKTQFMEKPEFISLPKHLRGKYKSCPPETIIEYVESHGAGKVGKEKKASAKVKEIILS